MIKYLLSPMVLMSSAWILATALYFLRWSVQFVFDPAEVLPVVGLILGGFAAGCLLALALHRLFGKQTAVGSTRVEVITLASYGGCWRMTQAIFVLWLILSSVQIGMMGGFPLLWLLIGDPRTYFDFGFPSLNGLLNSMVLACSLSSIYRYLITQRWQQLWMLGIQLAYSIMVINRQMLFAIAFEGLVLYLMHYYTQWRVLLKIVPILAVLFVANGIIGQYRTGDDNLKDMFQLRFEYSDLPGNVVWVYAYLTTPINNLINTIFSVDPTYNPAFPHTFSLLVPSVLRDELFANVQLLSARLYVSGFTVSTAMVDPYLDFGYIGMGLLAGLYGFLAQLAWFFRTPRPRLAFAVLAQCILLSVFSNALFYLPSIFQLFWIFLISFRYRPSGIYETTEAAIPPDPLTATPAVEASESLA